MGFAKSLVVSDLMAKPDSICDIVDARAAEHGVKVFMNFIDEKSVLTYSDVAQRSNDIAKGLHELGILPGAKVGLLMSSSTTHVLTWFSTLRGALVDVPINPEFRGEVLDHAIIKIEVSAVFADREGLTALASASDAARRQIKLLVVPDDVYDSFAVDTLAGVGIDQVLPLRDVEAVGQRSVNALPVIDPSALASIRFSSGTTGLPKGVMMDHGHMLASARKFNELIDFGENEVMFTCFPFHHVFATITGIISTLCAGGSLIITRKFSASRYWQDIRENGVTRAHILDPLVPLLMKQPPSEFDRQHGVVRMYTTAGYYPEFEERFGVSIVAIYDMSELTVVAHYPPGEPRVPGSCGKLSGLFDVAIVDDGGRELSDGHDGEIMVRPCYPGVMFLGYYNDAEQTVERWRDLWFRTGDRGRKGLDGYFYFLGRSGDRIRRRGVNISAEQIEKAALAIPAVLECAAIAVPSPLGEDDIKLCLTLTDGSAATEPEIADQLNGALPKALYVRYFEILTELPKTQTEKVRRAALRQLGDQGLTAETWDHEDGTTIALRPAPGSDGARV